MGLGLALGLALALGLRLGLGLGLGSGLGLGLGLGLAREDLDLAGAGAARSDEVGAELLAELRAVEQARLLAAALVQHGVWSPRHLALKLARLQIPQLQLVAGLGVRC